MSGGFMQTTATLYVSEIANDEYNVVFVYFEDYKRNIFNLK